ncbi:MAG: protein-disulfide reductase DsbD [Proteobacteria bacterium]|nr:protein-disulfide reductase DsbD [Pseudomonadota bacterium]MBU4296345.1 protein-disulfide reductase DsbD [Pseudomonadota bacterium]MCG2749212.1 protein-disulfide reductase DsbD [Desulfobulbaceae bacterium]
MTKKNDDQQIPAVPFVLRPYVAACLTALMLLLLCYPGRAAEALLKPEDAFRFEAVVKGDTIQASWTAADDYYLYRDRISFASGTPGVELGEPIFPVGKLKPGLKPDGSEGEVETYTHTIIIAVPITASVPGPFKLIAHGQGCAEKLGLCYPPQTREKLLTLAPAGQATESALVWNTMRSLLLALLSGIGLAATPCVLPMLPITTIIAGQSGNMTRARGAMLAAFYVLGTAFVWSGVGVLAGLTGQQLQAYTLHPYFLLPSAGVLVLLSLAMFGVYDLQMPALLQSKAQVKASGLRGGTFGGVFMMGMLSSVIAGACVSPILILNLGAALDSRDPVLGGAIMFLMALGMGAPMILLGIGAGWLLPKAGSWMNTVKHAFGVVMVGLAMTIVTSIPWMPVLYLWAPFLIIVGGDMLVRQSATARTGWKYLWKAGGTLLILWGVFALIGAVQGNREILRPVQLNIGSINVGADSLNNPVAEEPLFERVHDINEMTAKFAQARKAGKSVFLDYYAPWCTDCKIMEKNVFADSEVRAVLGASFVVIQADLADQFDKRTQPMKDKFGVFGPPAMLFFDEDGNLVKKVYGLLSEGEFIELARIAADR